ncbi:hypothetical protein D9M73_126930 [compost metagenome]
MVPVAIDAEPLQLLALHIDPMLRISAALGAKFVRRNFVLIALLGAILLLDLPLDRQAVAVPTGHIGRILAEQGLRAAHRVLQDMVKRMADMHVAIRIRRAVMEDELLPATASLARFLIQTHRLPPRENARLLGGQAGFHRKVGLRQEDGVAPISLGVAGGGV